MQHRLEFVAEGEGHLRRDKTLENATNSLEHEHVDDTVQVLLDHVVHHVRVLHHVHRVGCGDLPIQIAIAFFTEELFSGLDGVLGDRGLGLRLSCIVDELSVLIVDGEVILEPVKGK